MKTTKLSLILIVFLLTINSCKDNKQPINNTSQKTKFALVVHGGAGSITKGKYSDDKETQYKMKLEEALTVGYEILNVGGSSIDAVESVIRVLEDSPLFNAGKGAVLTELGDVELDASIMSGKDINAGGVASVTHIKNPISLARFVMEHSPHVLMFGVGAEKFADEFGLQKVENNYFKTKERIERFNKSKSLTNLENNNILKDYKFGTVGCVALDKKGNLAAGTSTGGMSGKKYGRVGDSPIIGAGTYANNNTCAISATGQGECFIRNVVAYDISALMEYKGLSLKDASEKVIKYKLPKQKASGGIIGVDKNGNIVMPFNTDGMFRGFIKEGGEVNVGMYK